MSGMEAEPQREDTARKARPPVGLHAGVEDVLP